MLNESSITIHRVLGFIVVKPRPFVLMQRLRTTFEDDFSSQASLGKSDILSPAYPLAGKIPYKSEHELLVAMRIFNE